MGGKLKAQSDSTTGTQLTPHPTPYTNGNPHSHHTSPLPGKAPTPTTRLLLVNEELGLTASLSAMTVVHGDMKLYEVSQARPAPCLCDHRPDGRPKSGD